MRNRSKPQSTRLRELEEEVNKMHNMIIMLGIVADLLDMRGIITRKEINEHINAVTQRLQQQAGSKTGGKDQVIS